MKRVLFALLIVSLIWGCQKQAEEKPKSETPAAKQSEQSTAERLDQMKENAPVSPEPRYSEDSKIWLSSAEGRPGEQVKLEVRYKISEPSKTIVVPLTYLGNAEIDSFSWVGSSLEEYGTKPVNIRNDLKIFLAAVVPITEPDIPAGEGLFGSLYFTIDKDAPAQTVSIETTFVYPGNTLTYVDTLIGAVTPQWESGLIKVIK